MDRDKAVDARSIYDAVIVGGSFAGSAAALYLGRARCRALVLDDGMPRNRFSDEGHGFLGMDGLSPDEIQRKAHIDLSRYKTIELARARATRVTGQLGAFDIETSSHQTVRASRIILAHGMVDAVPDIPGLAEGWGQSVLPCPYCHGYEVADQATGVILTHPGSLHQARLLRDWTSDLTVFSHDVALDASERADLESRAISIVDGEVASVRQSDRGGLTVCIRNAEQVVLPIIYVVARAALSAPFAADLGCDIVDGPFGPIISVDDQQLTAVPGVYAAVDITRPVFGSTWAAADGMSAGIACHQSLVLP